MDYDVILIGGGPVGMMLAGELALAGVNVCILERLKSTTPFSRALTVHPRTLEIMDMRGLKSKLLDRGRRLPMGHFASLDTPLDFSVLDSSSNHTLFLPQSETEEVLEQWALDLGVEIRRETEALSVHQDEEGVAVRMSGPQGESTLRSAYVVGTDGAKSLVRKQAGIPFEGHDATFMAILADAALPGLPPMSVISRMAEKGIVSIFPIDSTTYRILMLDPERSSASKQEPVTLEELRSALMRTAGSDFGLTEAKWASRFGNATRQAGRYRDNRLFLAGDAAHIHFPAGGQGMNVGLQEAVNLGWKLAGAVQGWAPEWLLDSYHAERFPWSTAMLGNTEAQFTLMDTSPGVMELRSIMSKLLLHPEVNRQMAEQISAFNVHYAPDDQAPYHALNGKRSTELILRLKNGDLASTYQLLRSGKFLLLHLSSDAKNSGEWDRYGHLQVIEASLAAKAPHWDDVHTALIRPDGHIAWAVPVSDPDPAGAIRDGVVRWAGELSSLTGGSGEQKPGGGNKMDFMKTIQERRSIRRFRSSPVDPELVFTLLREAQQLYSYGEAAAFRCVYAGTPDSRERLAACMLEPMVKNRLVKWLPEKVRDFVRKRFTDIPGHLAVIAVTGPDRRESDLNYAAVCGIMQNFQLVAWQRRLGVLWDTEPMIQSKELFDLFHMKPEERLVGIFHLGFFDKIPKARARTRAEKKWTVLPGGGGGLVE